MIILTIIINILILIRVGDENEVFAEEGELKQLVHKCVQIGMQEKRLKVACMHI